MRIKNYVSKTIAFSLVCLFVTTFFSCNIGNSNPKEWKDPELVEIKDTDRSIQYYLPFNLEALAKGKPLTTDDLQASGRLLLTSGETSKHGDLVTNIKEFIVSVASL